MRKSPFRRTSNGSATVTEKVEVDLPNDEASLVARSRERRAFDLDGVGLTVRNLCSGGAVFERSFKDLALNYPSQNLLIRQLLYAANLDIGSRLVSFTTNQDCYYGIEEFVYSLNAKGFASLRPITSISEIDFQVTKNFVAYLLLEFPGRTVNRKRYARVKNLVTMVKKKHDGDPLFGSTIAWAQSPQTTDTPSESYPTHIFNQLVAASLSDIQFTTRLMGEYSKAKTEEYTANGNKLKVTKEGIINGATRSESNAICSRAVAQFYPDWPLNMSLDDANMLFSRKWEGALPLSAPERAICRALRTMRITRVIEDQATGLVREIDYEVGQLAYMCQFYFTATTLYPFVLYVQLNTGWNLESVLSLKDDFPENVSDCIVDPDQYVILYGDKERSGSVVPHRSSKKNPYSVYNVLKFVWSMVVAQKESKHYIKGSLWQMVLTKNLWNRYGYMTSKPEMSAVAAASRSFLLTHGIVIDNETKEPAIESRRLRTTYQTKRKEQGLSVEETSALLGHANVDTTIVNYDSDSGSTGLRNKKLRGLLNAQVSDFSNYAVKLVQSETLAALREDINKGTRSARLANAAAEIGIDADRQIIHLLSPGSQTYISACLDPTKPTWPGHEQFVRGEDRCSFFNKCCMCSQGVIFREALPYIARRLDDLDNLKAVIGAMDWAANFGEEYDAWSHILKVWKPQTHVAEAMLLAKDDRYALPLAMRGPR